MSADDPNPAPAPTWIPLAEVATALRRPVTAVTQLLRHRQIIGDRVDGVVRVPAEFIADGDIVAGLPGTITVLTDAGLADDEIVTWLFTPEPTLGGSAIAALRRGIRKEVHRRAQVAGF